MHRLILELPSWWLCAGKIFELDRQLFRDGSVDGPSGPCAISNETELRAWRRIRLAGRDDAAPIAQDEQGLQLELRGRRGQSFALSTP